MARVETTRLQFEVTVNGQKAGKSIKDLRKDYRSLRVEVESLPKGSDEYNKKLAELAKLNAVLDEHSKKIRGIGLSLKEGSSLSAGFSKVVGGIGTAIKTAFGPIGLIISAVTAIVGMGKAAVDSANEMQKLTERTNQLTGLVGEDLKNATATVSALGKTFEIDVAKGIDAANAAANVYKKDGEELGAVYQQTLDKIGDRLLGLPEKGDEFLDQISEYSGRAQEAGLSMDRFFNLVTEGINRGVPTDKLIDSVKEFDIRIKTITKGQKETLENVFGKQFTDTLVKDVETGKITSIEALDQISGKIGDLGENSAAANKVISDLFGGPGEDATAGYIALIKDVGESLDDVVDTSNIYIQRKQELLDLEKQSALATAELGFQLDGSGQFFKKVGIIIQTGFVTGLAKIVEIIRYFPEYFAAATSSGKAFANVIIAGLEQMLIKINPVFALLEKIIGIEIKLPRFAIENDPYADVKAKIAEDRKAFEEAQRQDALIEAEKAAEAERMARLQAEKAKNEELAKLKKREAEEAQKLEAQLQKSIEDLRIAVMEDGLEKEIELIRLRYKRQIDELKGSEASVAEATRLLEERKQQEVDAVTEKYRLKRETDEKNADQKNYRDRLAALDDYHKKKILEITLQTAEEIEAGLGVDDADAKMKANMLAALRDYLEKKKKLEEEFGQPTTDTEQQQADTRLQQDREESDKRLKIYEKEWQEKIAIAESASNAIASFSDFLLTVSQNRTQKELKAIEEKEAKALKAAGDNEKLKAGIQERFQKQAEALREKQAKREQRIAVGRAIVDGALAIMRIAADVPKADFGIATALLIAAQVAATATQIAAISSVSYERGGKLPYSKELVNSMMQEGIMAPADILAPGKGGVPKGPSHKEGHILLVDGRTGKLAGAVEGGEPILSKETYRNNRFIVDRLLDASMNRGGAAIEDELRDIFFGGKRVPDYIVNMGAGMPAQSKTIILGSGGLLPLGRPVSTYADGGFLIDGPSTTPARDVVDTTSTGVDDTNIRRDLRELIDVTRSKKYVLIGENTVEMLQQMMEEMASDKSKRQL